MQWFRISLGLTDCGKVDCMWKSRSIFVLSAPTEKGVVMELGLVWKQVVSELEILVSKPLFEAYIRRLQAVGLSENENGFFTLILACQNAFQQAEVEKRWLKEIEEIGERIVKNKVLVKLVVDARVGEDHTKNTPLFENIYKKQEGDRTNEVFVHSGLKKELSLESFAVSSSNEMAYAAAKAVAKSPGTAYNPLFLYGGVGVGKTHLMQGVGQSILKKNSKVKLIYCSGEEFTNEIIDAIRNKSTSRFRNRYRNVGVLLIDDIQFIAGKAAVQEEFFHTFNAIVKNGGQIILTSDKPPKQIDSLEERLRSRFEGGLAIDIGDPDFELRSAILMIKSKQMHINLPNGVAQEIAAEESNVRALLGKLMKVLAVSSVKKIPLTIDFVRETLKDERKTRSNKAKKIKPEQLIEFVANYYQAEVAEVVGPKRVKRLTLPRHVAMYLMKVDLEIGLVEIGKKFGGRDHTSVMHAVTKVSKMIRGETEFSADLNMIRKEVYGW